MKDPGSFTIPCSIGKYEFKKALCDSGASINLMPLSVVQRLSLEELNPTAITLHMADMMRIKAQRRSMFLPKGDGSFQVLKRINENAYKLDLPSECGPA